MQEECEEGEEDPAPKSSKCKMTDCQVDEDSSTTTRVQCYICEASLHQACVKNLMAEHFEGDLYGERYYCDRDYNCVMVRCIPASNGHGRGAATQHRCQVCERPVHSLCMRALVGGEFEGDAFFCDEHVPESLKPKVRT